MRDVFLIAFFIFAPDFFFSFFPFFSFPPAIIHNQTRELQKDVTGEWMRMTSRLSLDFFVELNSDF